jgi:hypothetical protein
MNDNALVIAIAVAAIFISVVVFWPAKNSPKPDPPPNLGPFADRQQLTCAEMHREIDLLVADNKPGGIRAAELRQILHHLASGCQ